MTLGVFTTSCGLCVGPPSQDKAAPGLCVVCYVFCAVMCRCAIVCLFDPFSCDVLRRSSERERSDGDGWAAFAAATTLSQQRQQHPGSVGRLVCCGGSQTCCSRAAHQASDMSTASCDATVPLTLHNDLTDSLRLTWLDSKGGSTEAVPPSRRWLPPHGRQVLELPSAGGWLLGERLLWRGVVGAGGTASPTHAVRRDTNISVGAGATTLLPPLPSLSNATDAFGRRPVDAFVLLLNTEPQALQLCSAPPAPPGVAWRHTAAAHVCHGALPASGRRYLRGLQPGATLLAYEPVWGLGLEAATEPSPRVERVSRVLPSPGAPYHAAYTAHLRAPAHADAADAGGGVRVYNHLRETALLCGAPLAGEAEGALVCKARVRGLEHAWLPRSLVEASSGWQFLGLAQAVRLPCQSKRCALRLASPLAPAPAAEAEVEAAPPTGAATATEAEWTVHNAHDAPLRVCELPDGAQAALSASEAEGDESAWPLAAELASGRVTLRCVAGQVAAGQTATLQPPPDTRGVPRDRMVAALRPLRLLPTAAGEAVLEVGLGDAVAGEAGVPHLAEAAAPIGRSTAVQVAAAAAAAMAAVPPRPAARAASCAARYAHEAVTQILGSIEREWTNLTSALEAGQVPLEVPSDMIELGTDADPTRRVPLTKAIG